MAFARHLFHLCVIGMVRTSAHWAGHAFFEQFTELFHILHLRQHKGIFQFFKAIETRLFLFFSRKDFCFFQLDLSLPSLLIRTKQRHFFVTIGDGLPRYSGFFQQHFTLNVAIVGLVEFRLRNVRYRLLMSQTTGTQTRQFIFLFAHRGFHLIQLLRKVLYRLILLLILLLPLLIVMFFCNILLELLNNRLIIVKH